MDYNVTWRKKDKGWQCIISYKDSIGKWKQKSKQGFKTQKDGKAWLDKTVKELKKKVKDSIDPTLDKITFGEFCDMYLEHIKLYKAINTINSFGVVINMFSELKDKDINKITNVDIQKIIDKVVKKGNRTFATLEQYLIKLSLIFKAALNDYHIISTLPTKNIKLKTDKKKKSKKALTKQELDNLLKDFKDSKYYLVILIASTCGLRLGEILGITWDNVDFKNNTLTVNKQWNKVSGGFGFCECKSKNSYRVVPVPKEHYRNLKNIEM
ncbi:Arm DNA-binding domain-containing protein [Clostridium brassicae]|uniref:Arm DNA-binding domain-containing protein n=1 Tax=Clostridium brassicae TaxID=2999072 RepID=UPI002DD6A4F2|nr:Arm DNA-binding domain-containing protein [Clostridium brassicae]